MLFNGNIVARPETEPKTPLAGRLREVRRVLGDPDREGVALALGISKNTLAYYERGERTPDADVLRAYSEQFMVDMNWLVRGDGEMRLPGAGLLDLAISPEERRAKAAAFSAAGPGAMERLARMMAGPPRRQTDTASEREPILTDLNQPDMVSIPRYDEVQPSAGPGAEATNEIPSTRVAFERHWLTEIGVQTDAAVILPARGDSMEPTIMDGSPMLVDTSKTEVQNGYIYVIAVANDLLVKRIRRRLDGRIDLISDNRAYDPETLDAAALQQLRVIGRVYAAVSKF